MLGVSVVGNLCVGGNATYTNNNSFSEMQDVIDQCIQESLVTEINSSDTYCLMIDESNDVTINKKLVVYAKKVSATAVLNILSC